MRGGRRKGAGRPRIDTNLVKTPVSYKLPRWLVEWMRAHESPASQLIEDALRRQHRIAPPKQS